MWKIGEVSRSQFSGKPYIERKVQRDLSIGAMDIEKRTQSCSHMQLHSRDSVRTKNHRRNFAQTKMEDPNSETTSNSVPSASSDSPTMAPPLNTMERSASAPVYSLPSSGAAAPGPGNETDELAQAIKSHNDKVQRKILELAETLGHAGPVDPEAASQHHPPPLRKTRRDSMMDAVQAREKIRDGLVWGTAFMDVISVIVSVLTAALSAAVAAGGVGIDVFATNWTIFALNAFEAIMVVVVMSVLRIRAARLLTGDDQDNVIRMIEDVMKAERVQENIKTLKSLKIN